MQPFEKIQEYTKSVCDQIRWKKAHPAVTREIENHLIDQRDAYIVNGVDEMTATRDAIEQMGDPVAIGTQLDRTHRPRPQWSMIALLSILLFMGTFVRVFMNEGLTPGEFIGIAVGLGLMAIVYFSDFTLIGKYPKAIYVSILTLSVVTLRISPILNGRAFYAQFMTLLFPLAFAAILYAMRNKGYLGIILCGLSYLLPAYIAAIIPVSSGFLLFTVSGLILISIGIAKNWFGVRKLWGYLLVFVPTVLVLLLAAVKIPSLWARLQVAIDPSIDMIGGGWMGFAVRSLLSASKLFGHGDTPPEYEAPFFPIPKESMDKDFLLTYLIFKFGWIVFIVVMGLLLFFIIRGFTLCLRQKSSLGLFVSTAIMLTFTMEVVTYVVFSLGFQFTAPIVLPLISYGKIADIINLFLIGIMLSVFRTGYIVSDKAANTISDESFITWSDGRLIISFGRR